MELDQATRTAPGVAAMHVVLAAAVEALRDPFFVWLVSPAGPEATRAVHLNPAALVLTGRCPEDGVGAALSDVFPVHVANVLQAYLGEALRRGTVTGGGWTETVLRANGALSRVWSPTMTRVDDHHVVMVLRDDSEGVAHRRQLQHASEYDPLTRLLRRESGLRDLDALLAYPQRGETRTALAYCDLDGFKLINDRHGHAVGDQVLTETGARIRGIVRAQDLVIRMGGDEILVALAGVDHAQDALHAGEKIADAVTRPIHVDEEDVSVTVSVGVVLAQDGEATADAVVRADLAMYSAKKAGKNRVVLR